MPQLSPSLNNVINFHSMSHSVLIEVAHNTLPFTLMFDLKQLVIDKLILLTYLLTKNTYTAYSII